MTQIETTSDIGRSRCFSDNIPDRCGQRSFHPRVKLSNIANVLLIDAAPVSCEQRKGLRNSLE